MAVTLLPPSNGMSSLEFAPANLDAVRQAISDLFGEATNELRASHSRIAFGGETFLFEQEWDEPCLIADTEAGSQMLKQVARLLNGL
jgi:hypothetical protein